MKKQKPWANDKVCTELGYDEGIENQDLTTHYATSHMIHAVLANAGIKGSMLDVGCGSGKFIKVLPDSIEKYIGVDINKRSIDYAKKYFHDSERCEFHVFDIEDDNMEDIIKDKVDIIYFDSTLTMLKTPFDCLTKMYDYCDWIILGRTPHNHPMTRMSYHSWVPSMEESENWKFNKEDLDNLIPKNWKSLSLMKKVNQGMQQDMIIFKYPSRMFPEGLLPGFKK